MCKTDTSDVAATLRQIRSLKAAGAEIVRLAVKNRQQADSLKAICHKTDVPLVADIHFDYRLAIEAIENGCLGLRLNPGNIHRKNEVKKIVALARQHNIPIRVGLNSGSLPKRYPHSAGSLVKCARDYIKMLEDFLFFDIIVSLKASEVITTVRAYQEMAGLCDYPFHLGITASGPPGLGTIKSAIGIGSLLLEGIGDTIRVSLTASATQEIETARQILASLELKKFGPEIISCPTCGRCQVDLVEMVKLLKKRLERDRIWADRFRSFKIAMMGCPVNGPGEAAGADVGIAWGKEFGILFRKGRMIKRVARKEAIDELIMAIRGG
jgi:(E)-4-hydroxy-3-methylbut-2-enyl-diphosphate synthase